MLRAVIHLAVFATFTLTLSLSQKTCSKLGSIPGLAIGSRLVGSTYIAVTVSRIQDCVTSCLRQKRCLSFNYQSSSEQCELNDSSVTTAAAANLQNASEWSHVGLADWPRTLAGMCEANHCGQNAFCKTNDTGYYCTEVELCMDPASSSYHGPLNVTKTGRTCQRWDQQVPHSHTVFPDSLSADDPSLSKHEHYCRPEGLSVPWCYTMESDTRWEECYVPTC